MSDPLAICLVCPYALNGPHAVAEHVRETATALAGRGHRVTVLAPSTSTQALRSGRRRFRSLASGDVQFTGVTTFKGADGQPFAPMTVEPEGLVLTKAGTLVATSEGFPNRFIDPWLREFSLAGSQLRALNVPVR